MSEPEFTNIKFHNARTTISVPFQVTDVPSFGIGSTTLDTLRALQAAAAAIATKAQQLGGLTGKPLGDVEFVPHGYVRRFEGADIYFKDEAHEVHGDIRAKYNALNGPWGILGIPVTDEQGTPDGVGRFNFFTGGAMYWTPSTGPMMVRGPILETWGDQGFEKGPLGYPVMDEYRFRTMSPSKDPVTLWSLFQNGAIMSTPEFSEGVVHLPAGTEVTLTSDIPPDALRRLVRKKFDEGFHKSPDNVGLQPQVETLAVSDWSYGFWASRPRMITFRLHGFRDNGLAPDTDFELEVRLRFGLSWSPTFTEPVTKSVVVELDSVSVTAHGPGSGSVADGVSQGVADQFGEPQVIADIPVGGSLTGRPPDYIGLLVTMNGGLQILVNPIGPGMARKQLADNTIEGLING
jgi:hypothetical protein